MWTPKRIALLVCGFVLLLAVYVAYGSTYIGHIDGLPPLPEEFWPCLDDPVLPTESPAVNPLDRKLRLAFGPKCEEQMWPLRLELHSKNMVLAARHFQITPEGGVCLTPLSLAVFGKPKGDGRPLEFNTLRGDVAYLTFDRPIKNPQEIGQRKIVKAELRTRITVLNNRRRLQRDEDLEVHIATGPLYYSEPQHQIWTDDSIHLIDRKPKPSPNEIRGKGMVMDLETEAPAPPRPGVPARKPKGEAVTGVKRIVLRSDVDMKLYIDGRSGFLAGQKSAGEAAKPNTAAPPPARDFLHIRTPGPFHYDIFKDHDLARFDLPPANPAGGGPRTPQHVTVVRLNQALKTRDQLVCHHLELRLRRNDSASAGPRPAPGTPAPAARAADPHSTDQGLDVETAHATAVVGVGKEVTLTSDAEKLIARGHDFFYDARRSLTILKGEPHLEAQKGGSTIIAREMEIEEVKPTAVPPAGGGPARAARPEEKGYQKILAKGPGCIHMLDKATEKQTTHAYWQELLTSTRDGPHDLLILTGAARFVDDRNEQTLDADVIKVWLEPPDKPPEGAQPAKPKGDNAGNPHDGRRPHHVEATGHVIVRSRDLNVHDTSRFVVWFKDVPVEELLPSTPPPENKGSPGPTARPDAGAKPAPKSTAVVTAPPAPARPPARPPASGLSSAAPSTPGPAVPSVPTAPEVHTPDPGEGPARLPVGPAEPATGHVAGKPAERTRPALGGPELGTNGNKAEGPPPRPIDLSARSVEAHVLRSPAKSALDDLRAEGAVRVRQGAARPDEKDTDILGDELNLRGNPDGNFLVVRGDLAILCMDKICIFGPEVNIDQATDKAWVIGVGAMKMESATNFQGGKLDRSVPLTVHWNKSMFFNGKCAEFHGGIQAEQENARLACQRLQVYFDRHISLKQGNKGDQAAKVREMVCDRSVRIEDRLYEGDKLLEFKRLVAPWVQMNALEPDDLTPRQPPTPVAGTPARSNDGNEVHASGPGFLTIVKRGGPDPLAPPEAAPAPKAPGRPAPRPPAGPAPARAARPGGAPAPAAARGAAPPPNDELKLTYVSFQKRMDANSRSNTALFWENVRVLNMPCENPNQPIDLDAMLADLPEGAMYLRAERLKVLDQPENGRSNQQMEAHGRVYVQGKDFYARADSVYYNQAKDQVILDGKDSGEATLYKQPRPGMKPEEFRGSKIIYSRTSGRADVIKGSEFNGSSLSTPRK